MIRCLFVMPAVLLLSACASTPVDQWQKPDQPASQRDQDLATCKYEAEKAVAGSGDGKLPKTTSDAVSQGVADGMRQADLIKSCMTAKGYRP